MHKWWFRNLRRASGKLYRWMKVDSKQPQINAMDGRALGLEKIWALCRSSGPYLSSARFRPQKVIGSVSLQGLITLSHFYNSSKILWQLLKGNGRIGESFFVIIMDNARIHIAKIVQQYVLDKDVPVLYSGVAFCESAPVEMLFSYIKQAFGRRCTKLIEDQKALRASRYSKPLTEKCLLREIVGSIE